MIEESPNLSDEPPDAERDVLAALREGIADMEAGRTVSADEAFEQIRKEFGLEE
jgi:predicted transcriptional regulator